VCNLTGEYEGIFGSISKIFINENVLHPEYVPKKYPHRRDHLLELGNVMKNFLINEKALPVKVVLLGPPGTGKTMVARKFGEVIRDINKTRRGLHRPVDFVIINCFIFKSPFSIYREIARGLGLSIPRRGFSKEEVLKLIVNRLESQNKALILALDEADFLTRGQKVEVFYDLARLVEVYYKRPPRISLIFIMRNPLSILNLDGAIKSTLFHYVIKFKPYRKAEIIDILWARIEEGAMYPSAVDDVIMDMIGELVGHDKGGNGDARMALEILFMAGKRAERLGRNAVTPEDVRESFSMVTPFPRNLLEYLEDHEILLLLALVRLLKSNEFVNWVTTGALEDMYVEICDEYGIDPRGHTMVWEYIQRMKDMGILKATPTSRGKGRTTEISLPGVPLNVLENELLRILRQRFLKKVK